MKKLFLLLLVGWTLSTFLIGEKTQSVIKDYIEQSDKQSRELYDVSVKLVSYNKSFLSASAESKIVSEGKPEAKVVIKVFSSLTCQRFEIISTFLNKL